MRVTCVYLSPMTQHRRLTRAALTVGLGLIYVCVFRRMKGDNASVSHSHGGTPPRHFPLSLSRAREGTKKNR